MIAQENAHIEFLWKAWPDGYLAIPGLKTQGGWMCVSVEPSTPTTQGSAWYVKAEGGRYYGEALLSLDTGRAPKAEGSDLQSQQDLLNQALERGDLLTRVDPTDRATWACLLEDLAADSACQVHLELAKTGSWLLRRTTWDGTDQKNYFRAFKLNTEDWVEALVLIRILLRDERGI